MEPILANYENKGRNMLISSIFNFNMYSAHQGSRNSILAFYYQVET